MPAEQYFVVDPGKTFTVCDVANFGSTIPGIINVAHILISLLSWTFYIKNGVVGMELQMLFHITSVPSIHFWMESCVVAVHVFSYTFVGWQATMQ
jgi:hypothetical protein